MKNVFLLVIVYLIMFSNKASAESKLLFQNQVKEIDTISEYVERVDYARLIVVRNSAMAIIKDIESNVASKKNEVTFQTLRLIQNLIVQYRFSQVFFGWTEPHAITSIYTPATEDNLVNLKKLSEEVVSQYGYDDSPYTKISADTFRQMQRLLQQLESLAIDPSLKAELRALWMPIGETIAVAELGDRPRTFEKAIPLIETIRALYPMFDRISSSSAGFPMIMELQGLAEFYAEFAQMN